MDRHGKWRAREADAAASNVSGQAEAHAADETCASARRMLYDQPAKYLARATASWRGPWLGRRGKNARPVDQGLPRDCQSEQARMICLSSNFAADLPVPYPDTQSFHLLPSASPKVCPNLPCACPCLPSPPTWSAPQCTAPSHLTRP